MAELDPREDFREKRPQPEGELIPINVNPREDGYVKIGAQLSDELKKRLTELFENNVNLFVWVPMDMPGIDPNFMCHCLAIESTARLVAQRKRKLTREKKKIVREGTKKLFIVRFIREIKYTTWLSNVVFVEMKSKGTWQMYVNFTDLDKTCPKNSYPLPNIDELVEATFSYQYLSFMDAYSGYS